MHKNALVTLENVTLSRGNIAVLQNISLTIERGSYTTVVGPNGSGKTSLAKVLLGLFNPQKGTIERRKKLALGYVPQQVPLFSLMPITVERFLQLSRFATSRRIRETLLEVSLEKHLHSLMHQLSGGELQRVMLARALIHKPDLLILDEPVQNLDIKGQLEFYQLLSRIYKNRGCAVFMISHDLHMVMAQTSEVICLYHHICCSGKPQTLKHNPEFIHLFGNDMAKLLAIYEHEHDHSHTHPHEHYTHEHHHHD